MGKADSGGCRYRRELFGFSIEIGKQDSKREVCRGNFWHFSRNNILWRVSKSVFSGTQHLFHADAQAVTAPAALNFDLVATTSQLLRS